VLNLDRRCNKQEKRVAEEAKGCFSTAVTDDSSACPPVRISSTTGHRQTLQEELAEGSTGCGFSVTMTPIGVVRSVYRLCVGTPRQGLLAPHARGRIDLSFDGAADAVDGLEGYGYVWIQFLFHCNTVGKRCARKISPPALGGSKKVGVLATRSPHRFNPIGLSLVKLDRIEVVTQRIGNKKNTTVARRVGVRLHVSGLDLVDGTPVLDVKPYVPTYDAPPQTLLFEQQVCVLPDWVSEGLATKRSVLVSEAAQRDLDRIFEEDTNVAGLGWALEFYDRWERDDVLACIREVLAIDVRSTYQTSKAREGRFQVERSTYLQKQEAIDRTSAAIGTDFTRTATDSLNVAAKEDDGTPGRLVTALAAGESHVVKEPALSSGRREYESTQQLDNLLIRYKIRAATDAARETSMGSGAEDVVTVSSIELLQKEHLR